MKLSQYFDLDEFIISQAASRRGIDNTPNPKVINNLKLLCKNILDPAREALGPLKISSGFRCTALNNAVGGSKTSAHTLGYAADIIPLKASKMELAKWISKNVEFDQLILEFGTKDNPDWIHVSVDPKNRKQVLQILGKSGFKPINLI